MSTDMNRAVIIQRTSSLPLPYDQEVPACLHEFLEWSRCIKKQGHECASFVHHLFECVRRHGDAKKVEGAAKPVAGMSSN